MSTSTISVYYPEKPLQVPFPLDKFMGKWFVIRTTLNFWQKRKNATITYTPNTDGTFEDVVSYHSSSAKSTDQKSTVVGVDSISPLFPSGNGFIWRGRGFLRLLKSDWSVIAFHLSDNENGDVEPEWAVTYFSATLFTKKGIDIYSRTCTLDVKLLEQITEALKGCGNEEIAQFAEQLFPIIHN